MPARSIWKGFIRLSLVSVPVKAYTASATQSEIHLRQLHRECNSPIKYQKTCPIHGEVSTADIVSGYEYSKGQYVVIEPEEIDKMRTEADKAVNIDGFVSPDVVDPLYLTGSTYYLLPEGAVGQKPYALLHKGMVDENRFAIAQTVLFRREHVVVLRPVGKVIGMSTLFFENQVKEGDSFADELTQPEVSPEELKLAKTLIGASALEDFDLAKYKDTYNEKLTALIHAKVEGREIVAPPVAEGPKVINLMDALKQSLEEAKRKAPERKAPARKMAGSSRRPASAEKKRKKSS
jgi:DNA end-binding protein Ku